MKRKMARLLCITFTLQITAMGYLPCQASKAILAATRQQLIYTRTIPALTTHCLYSSQAIPRINNITTSRPNYKKRLAVLVAATGFGIYGISRYQTPVQAEEHSEGKMSPLQAARAHLQANRGKTAPEIPHTEQPNAPIVQDEICTSEETIEIPPFIRPASVQEAADDAFEYNRHAGPGEWLYRGQYPHYDLLGIEDEKLITHLAASGKKDIYIMDVGAAQGAWGRHMLKLVQQEEFSKLSITFHIFSITGGRECEEQVFEQENAVLYQMNQFKIENIDEELQKRGFNLENKVDLVVSHWTLRHLADPFGTVAKIYSLLTPDGGKFLSNGFLFKSEESEKVKAFPHCPYRLARMGSIVKESNESMIFRDKTEGRDTGQFLMMRTNDKPLHLPLQYTGEAAPLKGNWQCMAGTVTEFRQSSARVCTSDDKDEYDFHILEDPRPGKNFCPLRLYCLIGDDKCEQLYNFLKDNGFYDKS